MIILKQLQVILQSFALYGILSSNKISFINSETSEDQQRVRKGIRERIETLRGAGSNYTLRGQESNPYLLPLTGQKMIPHWPKSYLLSLTGQKKSL